MKLYKGLNNNLFTFKDQKLSYGHYGTGIYLSKDFMVAYNLYSFSEEENVVLEYFCDLSTNYFFNLHEENFPSISNFRPNDPTPIKGDLAELLKKDFMIPSKDLELLKNYGYKGINICCLFDKTPDGGEQVLIFDPDSISLSHLHFSFHNSYYKKTSLNSKDEEYKKALEIALDFFEAEDDSPLFEINKIKNRSNKHMIHLKIKSSHLNDFQHLVWFHHTQVEPALKEAATNALSFYKFDYIKRVVYSGSEKTFIKQANIILIEIEGKAKDYEHQLLAINEMLEENNIIPSSFYLFESILNENDALCFYDKKGRSEPELLDLFKVMFIKMPFMLAEAVIAGERANEIKRVNLKTGSQEKVLLSK